MTSFKIPPYISRWAGVREEPPKPLPTWLNLIWAFVGSFCALATLQAIFSKDPFFITRGAPSLVASFGASAVLCFGVPEGAFSQPRSVIGGQSISAFVGIIFALIFRIQNLKDTDPIPTYSWVASSLATSVAICIMLVTKTTHPPAGATALLPIIDPGLNRLGWYYLAVVSLSAIVICLVACLTNNVQKVYPVFWWTPAKPQPKETEKKESSEEDEHHKEGSADDQPDSRPRESKTTEQREIEVANSV